MPPKIKISPNSPFTIENIPFGVIKNPKNPNARCASAIGDYALDLVAYTRASHLKGVDGRISFEDVFNQATLNSFAALPISIRKAVREQIQHDIREGLVEEQCLIPLQDVTMLLPMHIGGYSDFYCSLEHVRNCSPMTANVVPQNWFHAPCVYNGRASSVVCSPQPIKRPKGVFYDPDTDEPTYGASRRMDYELEMGYFVSRPVPYGETMDVADAEEHIFGFVLLNDWSARDIQAFEMKPLGPFHGKGFGTSISPWVITMEALEPFRCPTKLKQDPAPFKHLHWKDEKKATFDVKLSVTMIRKEKPYKMATSNLRYLYWTPFQQLAHHASAMCGMGTGDLLGTGTISGDYELGCLFEATEASTKNVSLPDGQSFQYLEDEDEIVLEAWCGDAEAGPRLGFGQCRGKLLPA
ncbi:putative fumarylacetoacetate hydrolase [Lophiostoma macrostomum CBS 122681]|uniref:Fumarylacetoacetase n=1 Tax=Lophiostoma macrostomum CBS 122681 TaxID=1314788 RepID=A0A6A6SZD6_9PLEO|nr:putative fumarylacetoacetate hydrolase [Lophiostoma macrostomum CBS 122681]